VRVLLDTHTLLWALHQPAALSTTAQEVIGSAENLVCVSLASLWECAIKSSIGKLDLPADFFEAIPKAGYGVLQIESPHITADLGLPMHRRGPCDRLLVAQAQTSGLVLGTRDPQIAKYDVRTLLA
jgi:PIN domain nuclease of toxin-antitoxin system